MSQSLAALTQKLQAAQALDAKRDIQLAAARFPNRPSLPWLPDNPKVSVPNGDDTAAIPDGQGHLLLAAEGLLPSFVARDPWFAGFCSIMVNVSDVSSMGGVPLAAVDVLFRGRDADNQRVLEGMQAAAEAYGVPVVGGHTGRAPDSPILCVAIVGRAQRLITSFDARPGNDILLAIDQRGSYRGPGNNFNAATCATSADLKRMHALLPELSEANLVHAGKDVSMAGIVGTLGMLCESSGCGALLNLDSIPRPAGVPVERWLTTFPSFGFLLATTPACSAEVMLRFGRLGVSCARIGQFQARRSVELTLGSERSTYLDLASEPLTSFGPEPVQAPLAEVS